MGCVGQIPQPRTGFCIIPVDEHPAIPADDQVPRRCVVMNDQLRSVGFDDHVPGRIGRSSEGGGSLMELTQEPANTSQSAMSSVMRERHRHYTADAPASVTHCGIAPPPPTRPPVPAIVQMA